jgi:hypothetical protein
VVGITNAGAVSYTPNVTDGTAAAGGAGGLINVYEYK